MTLDELERELNDRKGIWTIKAGVLLEVTDRVRFKDMDTVQSITATLAARGIMIFPALSLVGQTSVTDDIRLYRRGTAIAEIIEAAIKPGYQQDDTLRDAVYVATNATKILNRVRELVKKERQ